MKYWIEAARLRTLPLSVSGILVGSFYALAYPTNEVYTPTQVFKWPIFIMLLLTTLGLQILSNFANDYGDGIKGTDNIDRVGPRRAVQSGKISAKQMKNAMYITAFITLLAALYLIFLSFKYSYVFYSLFFILLGIIAIASAIRYTVGKGAYGYKGYGDVFVFIFFGLVSTIGSYFLFSKEISLLLFLPATAIGFLSVAVLNLNNLRDYHSDKKANKNTLVVKLGIENAKKYHYFLVVSAMILVLIFAIFKEFAIDQYFFIVAFFPLISHILTVFKNKDTRLLDAELKKVALTTFLLALILSLSMIYFLSDIVVNQ